jgi:deoxyribonuclease V
MKLVAEHPWNVTPKEAIAIQKQLRERVETEDRLDKIEYVAGVDVGFEQNNTTTRAAVAVLAFPSLELHEQAIARLPTTFPYVPGLLSFREIPGILEAMQQLTTKPDLLLCDGQGIAHPRRFGIASHLGVLCDIPAIGVAKTRLIGSHDDIPEKKGAWTPLHHKGEIIGAVLRTRENVKPLYISPGHRISLETAIDYVMACITKYRLPETTRWAHRLASGMAQGSADNGAKDARPALLRGERQG